MICEQEADGLKWCGGTDIKNKPGRYVPESWIWESIMLRKLCDFWTELLILVKLNDGVYDQMLAAREKEYSPDCNFLGVVDKKMGLAVEICNKEGENDVNGKEAIDNVVDDKECILLVRQKCKLERANPGGVNHQNNQ
jgi:hypothetical protein